MLDVLKFIFSNFWIWLGTVIIVAALAQWSPITINYRKDEK